MSARVMKILLTASAKTSVQNQKITMRLLKSVSLNVKLVPNGQLNRKSVLVFVKMEKHGRMECVLQIALRTKSLKTANASICARPKNSLSNPDVFRLVNKESILKRLFVSKTLGQITAGQIQSARIITRKK